jgi:hypothetical protein
VPERVELGEDHGERLSHRAVTVAGLEHLGDPLQDAVWVVLQPRILLQRRAGRLPSAARHLQRIQNQDDGVGGLQVASVEFGAGLGD